MLRVRTRVEPWIRSYILIDDGPRFLVGMRMRHASWVVLRRSVADQTRLAMRPVLNVHR